MLAARGFLRGGPLADKPRRENVPTFPAKKSNLKEGAGYRGAYVHSDWLIFLRYNSEHPIESCFFSGFSSRRLAVAGNVPSGALRSPPLLTRRRANWTRGYSRKPGHCRARETPELHSGSCSRLPFPCTFTNVRFFSPKLFPDLLKSEETQPGCWTESSLDVREQRFRTQGDKNIKASRLKNIFRSVVRGYVFQSTSLWWYPGRVVGGSEFRESEGKIE